MPTPSDNTIWYPGSGATHHITNDSQAMMDPTLYQGTEKLQIGNGSGLFIHSTGSSAIPSHSHSLKLQNILHVLNIKKNLLSIYWLTNDNYVYVEFHADHCIIKEEGNGRPLLKGTVRDGLYLLNRFNNPPVAFVAEKVAMELWHQRLEHPHLKILHRIIATHGLPTLVYNKNSFFDAWLSSKSHKLPYAKSKNQTSIPLELIPIFGDLHQSYRILDRSTMWSSLMTSPVIRGCIPLNSRAMSLKSS